MSSNFKEFPGAPSLWKEKTEGGGIRPFSSAPSWKEWIVSTLLLCITIISTTYAGFFYFVDLRYFLKIPGIIYSNPEILGPALHFSIPLIAILLAHEMGHFLACRHYGICCTLPFFIPTPIPFTGTFGAFIKIKSPFPDRRSLFDVGIAGPLAGFLLSLIVLWIGIGWSHIELKSPVLSGIIFSEPLIFRLIGMRLLHYDPSLHDLFVHPTAVAGLFGLLITSLNLLPIWQLDGGHMSYAVFGPRQHKKLSIAVLIVLMLVGLSGWPTPSYMFFGLIVLVLGYRARFFHPSTARDWEPLGPGRMLLAFLAFIILILCFTAVPISFA